MKMLRLVTATALLASGAAPASAQEPPPAGPFPVMSTMDRVTDHTHFNGSLAFGFFDDDAIDLGLRLDLGGQYVAPMGWGVYAAMPVSYVSGSDDSETALGNLEAGGTYQLPAGPALLVLRGGITLPTGPDISFTDPDFFVNLVNSYSRLNDLTSLTNDVTWLRLSGSLLHRQGQLFLRGDAGIDLPIAEDDGVDGNTMLRLNVGGGIDLGSATVSGELVTSGTTEDTGGEQWFHSLAVTGAFGAGSVRPYAAFILPLDESTRDGINFFLMGGLEVPIQAR